MTGVEGRRDFLRAAAAAGVAWAAADLLSVDAALAWASRQASSAGDPIGFGVLTRAEAATLDAAAARIIPSVDGRPGAHEAGVVHFIDKALGTFNASQKGAYRRGVRELDRRAGRIARGGATFASLSVTQQDEVLRAMEKTPFFQMLRVDTIFGMFALPSWGGNRNHAGWQMIGLSHQPVYQPPFGYYDADANTPR
jgi:gluconate 2-dehydrogenase gamma chain